MLWGTLMCTRSVEARIFWERAMDRLLKEDEAARLLQLSAATLQAWRTRKVGPSFVQLSRRAIRYSLAELEEFVKTRKVVTLK